MPILATMKRYEPRQFPRLKGLSGISDALLQDHLKLYEGYVKNTNELRAQLDGMLKDGKAKAPIPLSPRSPGSPLEYFYMCYTSPT